MSDLKSNQPAETLDVLGMPCPQPIILIKKEMEKLASGETLKILCDSETTIEEVIPHYCEKKSYMFKAVRRKDEGHWEVYIEKK